MLKTYLSNTKTLLFEFIKYYLAAILVIGLNGELFNIAMRYWSENQMSFYGDGLWQITLFLAFFVTCYVMFNKYCPE
ncbi:membrane protein [Photobacterium aquae]|uniref:Membrane protein n=1 Tax=Photobacterium aquae TaxID=1195763 RepID=A0A0J1GZW1_9GAMM|nr:membrane protein [Photobacterium aquae]